MLAQALSAVAKERPSDPVQFVADFLLRKQDENAKQKIEEKTTEDAAEEANTKPSSGGEVSNGGDSGHYSINGHEHENGDGDEDENEPPPSPAHYRSEIEYRWCGQT